MYSKKKICIGTLSLCALLVAAIAGEPVLSIDSAFAAADPSDSIFTTLTTGLSIFLVVINVVAFLIYPMLMIVVDPWFFVEVYTANQTILHTLWLVSRNIMNVIFVFILIGVAIMTVVTAKKDIVAKYAIKFVLAVVLVNFSWFFPRVILDVSNILTATIYKLPDIVNTQCRYIDVTGVSQPCRFGFDFRFFDRAQVLHNEPTAEGQPPFACPTSITCYRMTNLNNPTTHPNGILSGLILNHGRLPDLARVQAFNNPIPGANNPIQQISFLLMFIANTFFTLALSVTLLLAMIAMLVAFIIRIPVLWLCIAFMPFMFLGYVVGDLMKQFNTMPIFEHFVKAAFLPTVVAIPLTVGFLILNVMTNSPAPRMAGVLQNAQGAILPGINNLWTLLWMITTIIVIWKGFFMALSIDSIYTNATQGIQSFGGSLGNIVKSLPMNIPFMGVGRPTLGQMKGKVAAAASAAQYGQLGPDVLKKLKSGPGGGGDTITVKQQTEINNTITSSSVPEQNILLTGTVPATGAQFESLIKTLTLRLGNRGHNIDHVLDQINKLRAGRGEPIISKAARAAIVNRLRPTKQFR